MPIHNIFANLQKTLVAHGAKQIVFDYGDDGKIDGLTFTIKHQERLLQIQLPARLKEAKQLLREQGFRYDNEQVYRVAWRNILDWVEAQMAFIDIGQVKLEQVFFPYMVNKKGQTAFEVWEQNNNLLESGKPQITEGEVIPVG